MAITKGGVFRAGRVLAADSKWTGEEPEWKGWETWPVEKFFTQRMRMMNFYNYYLSMADMKPAVLAFMKREGYSKEEISIISSANPNVMPSTIGKLVRGMDRGMPEIHPNAQEYFDKLPFTEGAIAKNDRQLVKHEINDVLQVLGSVAKVNADGSPIETKRKSPEMYLPVMERLRLKVDKEVIAKLEVMIDEWCTSEVQVSPLNLTSYIRDNGIAANGCVFVETWLQNHLTEYQQALDKSDPDSVEGYSYLTKPGLKSRIKALTAMIEEVQKYGKVQKAQRVPRVKKTKDATKQVSSIKYQQNSQDYNLDSINPIRIPTAQRLYVFNTKYRQLSVYQAKGAAGFEVKGCSIKNFDPSLSFTTTLRKPQGTLGSIISSTPKQLEKLFDDPKIKKKEPNGRINEHIILLRVIENKI
jgi:hypothetical protein